MGTLELQVEDDVVFAYYRPPNAGINIGGYLGRVFPGGDFKGIKYEVLRALGTGSHQLVVDERARSERGQEPVYESEWQRLYERFKYSLFMYTVGACVAREVLSYAREVVHLESKSKPV